jgi:hypothetical protein
LSRCNKEVQKLQKLEDKPIDVQMNVNLELAKLQPKGLEGGALLEMIKLGIDLPSERLVEMTINGKIMRNHIKLI